MKLHKILVFSELPAALPALCSGANTLAEETVAAVMGERAAAVETARYAGRVLWLGEQRGDSMAEDYTDGLFRLIQSENPSLVLIKTTRRGRCIAGRLAVRLGTAVFSDVGAFQVTGPEEVSVSRMVYGGAASSVLGPISGCVVVLTGGGVFDAEPLPVPGGVEEHFLEPVSSGVVRMEVKSKQEERVDLTAAKRVVSAGRGVGTQENLGILEVLARKLGAELACSRPIAEGEHWMAKNRYVGVSGAVIKPDVYLACGISGQVQHLVGISGAKTILAINKDKNAPIFQHCDYGIVGDLNKIVPALTELL